MTRYPLSEAQRAEDDRWATHRWVTEPPDHDPLPALVLAGMLTLLVALVVVLIMVVKG